MKILVVDDEVFIRRMIKITLQAKDYQVILAHDGPEAISKALAEKPDIILLDIMMPVYDGFYVLEKLKKDKDTSSIPVIMLTSMGQTQDIARAAEMGANDYITKPFEYENLISTIERVAGKS